MKRGRDGENTSNRQPLRARWKGSLVEMKQNRERDEKSEERESGRGEARKGITRQAELRATAQKRVDSKV